MKSFITFLLLICISILANSQTIIEGQLFDNYTREPLPYCNVGIIHTNNGTITNSEGTFRIEAKETDTIACTFIGYHTFKIPVSKFPADGKLFIKVSSVSLPSALISADNFLYDLILNCKKSNKTGEFTAKTYFELDSYMEGKPVEMIECYYNGSYNNTDIKSLSLKSGKIYLADYDNHFFTNIETSKAVTSLHLFSHNDYFPLQPFELNKSNLKKHYQLKLVEKYAEGETVYRVEFTPTSESRKHFSGEAWIDSTTNQILKINLQITDASIHPFLPLWQTDSILQIDLKITEAFKKHNGNLYLDIIDFSYNMKYKGREKGIYNINTDGVLHVYDHENSFILPYFEYSQDLSDYRKISMFPYNDFFWKNRDSIVTSEKRNSNWAYFQKFGIELKYNMEGYFAKKFFVDNIIRWNPATRIKIKEITDTALAQKSSNSIPLNLYQLKSQIFVDVNQKENLTDVLTSTYFDVFNSYYRLATDSSTDCFANIYFDLIETERIDFENDLQKPDLTLDDVKRIYDLRMEHVAQISAKYFRETERGQNKDNMLKWNQYIISKLGIDNMKLHQLK